MLKLPFFIPANPDALVGTSDESVKVNQLVSPSEELQPGEAEGICKGATFLLKSAQGGLQINDQECLDSLYASIQIFKSLGPRLRTELVQLLCSLAKELATSIDGLASSKDMSSNDPAMQCYINAAQEYMFFMSWLASQCIAIQAADEQEQRTASQGSKVSRGRKPSSKASKVKSDDQWDCYASLELLLQAGANLVSADLEAIAFTGNASVRFFNVCSEMAINILALPLAAKQADTCNAAFKVLQVVAERPDLADGLSCALFDLARREEHAVGVVAQALAWMTKHGNPAPLSVGLVGAFISLSPGEYQEQAKQTSVGVKQAADLLVEVAQVVPKVFASNMALLSPYLGCKAVAVRKAVVRVLKILLIRVYAEKEEGSERAQESRVMSKDSCLFFLLARLLDEAAFVRVEVLKSISELIEASALPLPFWPPTLEAVSGRLEDGSDMVVKAALGALQKMIAHNLWEESFQEDKLRATLQQFEQQLELLKDADGALAGDGSWGEGDAVSAGRAALGAAGGAGVAGRSQASQEGGGGGGDSDGMDIDEPADLSSTQARTEQLLQPTQEEPATGVTSGSTDPAQMRFAVATLKTGLEILELLKTRLDSLTSLLASSSADVVKEAVKVICSLNWIRFPGSERSMRAMWRCVFSREESVRDSIVASMYELYLFNGKSEGGVSRGPGAQAAQLASLMEGASFEDMTAFTEAVRLMCGGAAGGAGAGLGEDVKLQLPGDHYMHPEVVKALLRLALQSFRTLEQCAAAPAADVGSDTSAELQTALVKLRTCLLVASMAAPFHVPHVLQFVQPLLQVVKGCMFNLQEAYSVRLCCQLFRACAADIAAHEASGQEPLAQEVCTAMLGIMASSKLSDDWWYTAAEAAMSVVYTLHPAPHQVMQPLLFCLSRAAFGHAARASASSQPQLSGGTSHASGAALHVSSSALSRAAFLAAHCAIHHLAYVDLLAKRIRGERHINEKLAKQKTEERMTASSNSRAKAGGEAAGGAAGGVEDDGLAAVGGAGAVTQDAALDALKERMDGELLAEGGLLRLLSAVIQRLLWLKQDVLQDFETLRGCLLLSLSKMMIADMAVCEQNMALFTYWLNNPSLSSAVTCSLMVSVADLATRFPNVVEPYTAQLYGPLKRTETEVKKTALTVLSHLILNDMMKVKGHIASIALCMMDVDGSIRQHARRFFTTLAHRSSGAKGGTNPIYNLLPDVLSMLSREAVPLQDVMGIMKFLLPFVKDPKQSDAFKEKLCARFDTLHEANAATAAEFTAAAELERQRQQQQQEQENSGQVSVEAASSMLQGDSNGNSNDDDAMDVDQDEQRGGGDQQQQQQHVVVKPEAVSGAATGVMPAEHAPTAPEQSSGSEQPATSTTQQQGGGGSGTQATAGGGGSTQATAGGGGGSDAGRLHERIARERRLLAYCFKEMGFTEKGARRAMDQLKSYKHCLGDKEVFSVFWAMGSWARKYGDKQADKKTDIAEVAEKYLAEIAEIHKALRLGMSASEVDDEGLLGGPTEQGNGAGEEAAAAAGEEEEPEGDTVSGAGSQQQGRPSASGTRGSTRAATASTGSRAGTRGGGGRQAAKKGGGSRRQKTIPEEEEEEEESSEGEVAGPRRGAAAGKSRAAPGSKTRAVSSKTSKVSKAAGTTTRRRAAVSSSEDDDDVSDGQDQDSDGGSGDDVSLGSQVKQMQRLKVTVSHSSGSRSTGARRVAAQVKDEPCD